MEYPECNQYCINQCQAESNCGGFVFSTSCKSKKLFSGWWFDEARPGTGLSIEFDGQDHWFLAWYVYDSNGLPTWYSASGELEDSAHFSSDLLKWTGWPWGSDYNAPAPSKVGSINGTLIDTKERKINLEWQIKDLGTGTLNLTNFMEKVSPGLVDSRNLTGWWYDPAYDGMGFFIEAKGETIFLAWYNYGEGGSPMWLTSTGEFPDKATTYSGTFSSWRNGQSPGVVYKQPQELPGSGNITLTFSSSDKALAVINENTILSLEKFMHSNEEPKSYMPHPCNDEEPGMVKCGTMTIDGDYRDWTEHYRVYADIDGPECDNAPGLDIREVYLAQDETFIYMRFVLNGPLAPTYAYKFGNSFRHIFIDQNENGRSYFYANAFGFPQSLLPPDFLHIDGNQFECKFYKSDVMPYWKDDENLATWNGQGFITECRDYIPLQGLKFDF